MYLRNAESPPYRLQGIGQGPALPRVSAFRFRNANGATSDALNCCAVCPVGLGVGQNGTASNGMELRFTIDGHRPGIEYDITRTRRNSIWQRRGGAWTSVEAHPMGTRDDHRDIDECLSPRGGRFIFAIDMPGWPDLALPAPAQSLGGLRPGVFTAADAQDVVFRLSFAEWVIARSRGEGIGWTPLALPPRPDGTQRRFVFWFCIVWLTRDGAGRLVLDARSRIALGSLSARTIGTAPA